jgi:hypothetical protein
VRHFSISRFCPRICVFLVLAAGLAGPCATAFSADVRLAWDAKSEPNLVGYKIYYGVASRSYKTTIDVGNVTSYTVTRLKPGNYYFCVTAYYTSGIESNWSNEVSTTVLPKMYGFRDESGSSQPPDAFPTGLRSRNLTENRRVNRSAQKDFFASSFHPVACRLLVHNDYRCSELLYQHRQCKNCSDG